MAYLGGQRVRVMPFGELAATFELLLRPRLVLLDLSRHCAGERRRRRRDTERALHVCALPLREGVGVCFESGDDAAKLGPRRGLEIALDGCP